MSLISCTYHDLSPRSLECLPLSDQVELITTDVTNCETGNGTLSIVTSDGISHEYALQKTSFTDKRMWSDLPAGGHMLYIRAGGCLDSVRFEIENAVSDLDLTVTDLMPDTECIANTGSAVVQISGGESPYTVTVDGRVITGTTIENLSGGMHRITVVDQHHCEYTDQFEILHVSTGVSWSKDISPIIARSCAKSGCHGAGSPRVTFLSYEDVKANAAVIKGRTQNRTMPYDGPLPPEEIALIACWVDDGALNN